MLNKSCIPANISTNVYFVLCRRLSKLIVPLPSVRGLHIEEIDILESYIQSRNNGPKQRRLQ